VTYTPSAVGAAPATSLSIVDDASNSPQTVSLTGTGTDFTVTGSTPGTPSATVPAGQPATYNLLLAPVSGFTGTVTMACDAKTLPSATSCTFNPAAPTLGATATQVMLTIGTTARTRALQGSSGLGLMTSGFVSVFGMLLCSRRTRRSVPLKWCMGLFFLGLLWTGCGGNSAPPVNPQNSGTPAGTYSVKVSGSAAGHTSAPLTVSLTVQ